MTADMAFKNVLYGTPTASTIDFFRSQTEKLVNSGVNFSQWVVDGARNIFNSFYSNDAIRQSQELLRKTGRHFREDVLHEVRVDDYHPNLMTAQYIMACPEIWELRAKGLSGDFGNTYFDNEPEIQNIEWRKDYYNTINGILRFEGDGSGYVEHYHGEEVETLDLEDQVLILDNWKVAKRMLGMGLDPTSK